MAIDWDTIGELSLDAVKNVLETEFSPLLDQGKAELKMKLHLLAQDIMAYAILAAQGDAGASENLKWIKSEARMIGARYALASSKAAIEIADAIVTVAGRILGLIIKSALM